MSSLIVHVGLDYHEETIRVCVLADDGLVLVNRNVANEVSAVQDLVSRFGHPHALAIEACCGAANFAAELNRRTDWNVRLAHAGYVNALKRGPDKTDHDDAHLLADLVRVNYLPAVWLADEETRELRRLVRYRQGLCEHRKATKLRIRALLREARVGCEQANAWTVAWRAWLAEVELGEHSRWVMDRYIEQLARVEEDIDQVDQRLAEATADDPTTQKLLAQPGIGPVTAVTMRAEIGRFDRFRTGKQLARFCATTPRNASSGKRQADGGLIKAGNKNLRTVVIEAAQRLPRHDERWREFKQRLSQRKPASVVTAAIANRWLRWLFHQMKPETPLDQAV